MYKESEKSVRTSTNTRSKPLVISGRIIMTMIGANISAAKVIIGPTITNQCLWTTARTFSLSERVSKNDSRCCQKFSRTPIRTKPIASYPVFFNGLRPFLRWPAGSVRFVPRFRGTPSKSDLPSLKNTRYSLTGNYTESTLMENLGRQCSLSGFF